MQELMSRHKTTSFSPRDCLKTILHQRWSKTCSGKQTSSFSFFRFVFFSNEKTNIDLTSHSEYPLSPSFQTAVPCQTVLVSGIRSIQYTLTLNYCALHKSFFDFIFRPMVSKNMEFVVFFCRHSTTGETTTKEKINNCQYTRK